MKPRLPIKIPVSKKALMLNKPNNINKKYSDFLKYLKNDRSKIGIKNTKPIPVLARIFKNHCEYYHYILLIGEFLMYQYQK